MKAATRTGLITVLLTSLVAACVVLLSAGTSLGASARPSSSATKNPPDIKGKKTRWGASIKGGQQQTKRKESPPPTGERRAPKAAPKRAIEPLQPAARRRPFRLNIGICGLPAPDGSGRIGPARCQEAELVEPDEPTATTVVRRRLPMPQDVTWEQVLNESKDVAFPGLRVNVQPAGRTLVNLDTIVYTDQAKVSDTTVELLGFPVAVEATPMSYTWNFGDGTSKTTGSPGKPYPAKEITHKYLKRGAVGVTLTTHYAARFNVAGTGWQYISGTVPITGPATALQVREAVPVLVDPPN
ncbi:PKD domain-containing protein [Kribbella sp. ALI-6-A]|uniref:PKD domain-containing protein n=1 Tax=Kribbella sp. ALI-6-A TaxID=1933817 RepID=UPI00117A13EC|nr:PKD domain-containing protein [Kribbella sp. ALI-6-A]